jgi:ubiquitin C-terminal hydrolase
MNSVLQCLTHLPTPVAYIRSTLFKDDLDRSIVKRLQDNKQDVNSKTVNDLATQTTSYHLCTVFAHMWTPGGSITPAKLYDSFCRQQTELSVKDTDDRGSLSKKNRFAGYAQHDSHEMLVHILDRIHEELVVTHRVRKLLYPPNVQAVADRIANYESLIARSDVTDEQKQSATRDLYIYRDREQPSVIIYDAYQSWVNHIRAMGHSRISDMFDGIYSTRVNCTTCHKESITFEVQRFLSLEIGKRGTEALKAASATSATSSQKSTTLVECIREFTREEMLAGGNMYLCRVCNVKVPAIKSYRFWDPPRVLVIQLKRFNHTASNANSSTRNDTIIDTPHELDLAEWMAPERGASFKYELFAVSLHHGGVNGGHYTAYARVGKEWYCFDDRSVYPVSAETVAQPSKSPYILFYEKKRT